MSVKHGFCFCMWYGMCFVCGMCMLCEHVMCSVCTCVCMWYHCVHLCICMSGTWGMWSGMYSEFVCMFMYICQMCL